MVRGVPAVLALLLAPSLCALSAQAQGASLTVADLLALVGEQVHRFYTSAQSVMCIETVSQQPLRYDLVAELAFPRRLVYELRMEWDAAEGSLPSEVKVQRALVRINNRAPRPKDKPRCLDPRSTSHESMEMLLPVNQAHYAFRLAGRVRSDNRHALLLDFRDTRKGPVTVTSLEDREECFSVDIPGRSRGRIWIDEETFEVLRIDEWLTGPVSVRDSVRDSKKRRADIETTFERLDSTIVYRPVVFTDPKERVMLPVSAEAIQISTGPNGSRLRTSSRFTNYQRFLTDGRILQPQ